MNVKMMGLIGTLLMSSAPVLAVSTSVFKCFSSEEMAKPKKERVSEIGFARLRDGKERDYAIFIHQDIVAEDGILDAGVFQLSMINQQPHNSGYENIYSADVSMDGEAGTDLIIKTQTDNLKRPYALGLYLAETAGNSFMSKVYTCSSNARFSRYARRLTKSFEEIRDRELKDLETILLATAEVMDTYNSIKAETTLKKRQYIDLKDKKPFSTVKVDVTFDESGQMQVADETLVVCEISGQKSNSSKASLKAECLKPNFTVKKRKKVKKRRINFRRLKTPRGNHNIGCEATGKKMKRKKYKPKKIGYKRTKLRLVKVKPTRNGKS